MKKYGPPSSEKAVTPAGLQASTGDDPLRVSPLFHVQKTFRQQRKGVCKFLDRAEHDAALLTFFRCKCCVEPFLCDLRAVLLAERILARKTARATPLLTRGFQRTFVRVRRKSPAFVGNVQIEAVDASGRQFESA